MSGEIFVSYRWGVASKDSAGRLAESLRNRLGHDRIIFDVSNEDFGERLPEYLLNQVRSAEVILIVIHSDWINSINRLFDKNDYVRQEIESAIEFDLKIIPVTVDDSSMPNPSDLPEEIKALTEHKSFITDHTNYSSNIDRLTTQIKLSLPTVWNRLINKLSKNSNGNLFFLLIIIAGLTIFFSRLIEIHFFSFPIELEARIGNFKGNMSILREGGTLLAWNWVAAVFLINPAMLSIFCSTLYHSRRLIDDMKIKKMVSYITVDNVAIPFKPKKLWDQIIQPTSTWLKAFIFIGLVLSITQWYQYSLQWLWRDYTLEKFIAVSTGPDWHVAWKLGVSTLESSQYSIVFFSLIMYLLYTVGSVVTFTYYAFLFNLTEELHQFASNSNTKSNGVLKILEEDKRFGGFYRFRKVQKSHASFCYLSVVSMYLMALRNSYLPPTCRIPEQLVSQFSNVDLAVGQCTNMVSFFSTIYFSFEYFLNSFFKLNPDFSILFFSYSEQNVFTLGSLLYVVLIASFFILISSKMVAVVESAKCEKTIEVGNDLISLLKRENFRVMTVLITGITSTIFLNFGMLMLLIFMIYMTTDFARKSISKSTE